MDIWEQHSRQKGWQLTRSQDTASCPVAEVGSVWAHSQVEALKDQITCWSWYQLTFFEDGSDTI